MATEPVRVLVVDDDFAVASLHGAFVSSDPRFEVVATVHSGREAVRAVQELRPDLLLLDIYLPDMTGLEVLAELRADPDGPVDVVVITAARELETVRSAMAGGVLHYLIKPFTAADLRYRLTDYLRHREVVRKSADRHELDQRQVDELIGSPPRERTAPAVPKGLSARSLAAVAGVLREEGAPLSAEDVAARVGMSRVAARRYLEHLAAIDDAQVQPRYGRAGRPQNLYRWAGGR